MSKYTDITAGGSSRMHNGNNYSRSLFVTFKHSSVPNGKQQIITTTELTLKIHVPFDSQIRQI